MRRHFPSLVLLVSLVLGGWIGPVSHLMWMRYGGPSDVGSQSKHARGADSHDGLMTHHPAGHGAKDGRSWSETQTCDDECLFLSLLAAQASALAPESFSMGTPIPEPGRFHDPAPRHRTAAESAVTARGPPSA